MDNLNLALRRYQQILPRPKDYVDGVALRRLKVWLSDDVLPVVEEYVPRPAFREHATWVLGILCSKTRTPERQQVDAVENALVRCARVLSSLASKERIRSQLKTLYPPRNKVVARTIVVGGSRDRRLSQTRAPVDGLAMEMSQVAAMVNRPWGNLSRADDYFEPMQEFVTLQDGTRLQRGEFIPSLNPELHLVGNFVVHCLFRRIDIEHEILRSLRQKVLGAVRKSRRTYRDQEELESAWRSLEDGLRALKTTHKTGWDQRLPTRA